MVWRVRYRLHRLKCQRVACGEMFEAYRKTQKFCSSSCALKNRGPAWWKAHAAKIAAIRRGKGYSRFVQRMRALGLTDDQIEGVRKEVMMQRSNAFTSGKRKGWQEACGETGDESLRELKARRTVAAMEGTHDDAT